MVEQIRDFDLVGLTNVLTDIIIQVSEPEFIELGLVKGTQRGIRNIDPYKLEYILQRNEKKSCIAGSPANTTMNSSVLGLKTGLLGTIGDDFIGEEYEQKLEQLGAKSILGKITGASGRCYIFVTPDYERTGVADMGVAGSFIFDETRIKGSRIFHTSGYELVSNPTRALEVINYMKEVGARISLDLASAEAIGVQRRGIEEAVSKTDILFMTEEEAEELTGTNPEAALEKMSNICRVVALKKGSKGSIVRSNHEQYNISPYPIDVVNTCGAGDAYASGFLWGSLRNLRLQVCGNIASCIASRVCGLQESHLLPKK